MKKVYILTPIALAMTLAGCIKPTTYHPFDGHQGYQTVQMNSRLFEVRFTGNVATTQSAVHSMMLYRAAEVTHQHHFRYFHILKQGTQRHRSVIVTPGYTDTTVYKEKHKHHRHRHSSSKQVVSTYTPPTKTVENSYTTFMRFNVSNRGGGNQTYNAQTIMSSLRNQIAWPKQN